MVAAAWVEMAVAADLIIVSVAPTHTIHERTPQYAHLTTIDAVGHDCDQRVDNRTCTNGFCFKQHMCSSYDNLVGSAKRSAYRFPAHNGPLRAHGYWGYTSMCLFKWIECRNRQKHQLGSKYGRLQRLWHTYNIRYGSAVSAVHMVELNTNRMHFIVGDILNSCVCTHACACPSLVHRWSYPFATGVTSAGVISVGCDCCKIGNQKDIERLGRSLHH
jgi:hypothetical protein